MISDATTSVGRVGHLVLDYERQGQQTVLARSRCNSPWHLLPTIALDDSGTAYTLLLNPSGGLVGGDHLGIEALLGPDAHVILSTPSANRVYRSEIAAVQSVQVHLSAGARLEWVPDLTIPYRGARFQQRIAVTLAPGASILCWDALASGRIARGERWGFTSLENEIRLTGPSGAPIVERYRVSGDDASLALVADWDYVGTLYLAGDAISAEAWKLWDEQTSEALEAWPKGVLAGISEPPCGGRVLKILARGASDLQAAFEAAWRIARARMWGLPASDLRRY